MHLPIIYATTKKLIKKQPSEENIKRKREITESKIEFNKDGFIKKN